jgi:hypothetical protein
MSHCTSLPRAPPPGGALQARPARQRSLGRSGDGSGLCLSCSCPGTLAASLPGHGLRLLIPGERRMRCRSHLPGRPGQRRRTTCRQPRPRHLRSHWGSGRRAVARCPGSVAHQGCSRLRRRNRTRPRRRIGCGQRESTPVLLPGAGQGHPWAPGAAGAGRVASERCSHRHLRTRFRQGMAKAPFNGAFWSALAPPRAETGRCMFVDLKATNDSGLRQYLASGTPRFTGTRTFHERIQCLRSMPTGASGSRAIGSRMSGHPA